MKKFLLLALLISNSLFAMTNEDQFILETQEELRLAPDAIDVMQAEMNKHGDEYLKGRRLFCAESGVGAVVDFAVFNCRNFKGEKIEMAIVGIGASVGLHAGVGILYAKKNSRPFREGTYNVSMAGIHTLLGIMSVAITNDNESINWRFKGLTVGAGINLSGGRLTMTKIQ